MKNFRQEFPELYTPNGTQCVISGCKNRRSDFTEEALCHQHFEAIVAKMFGDTKPLEEIVND